MSKANNLLHIVDFKKEQIIGVIKEQDYWDDLRQWELKDNKDKFEFTTADGTKIAASLIQQNLVVKQTRDGTFVSYIITEVEQDSTGRPKKIYALGEHTKLKKATVIKPQTLQATTVNESMDFALQGTEWKRGITEYVGIRTINIKDFTNPLDLLKQIASTFELEIRFKTEILGSFIVGRYVDLVKKVGRDNGKEFLLGKDVQGIRRIENSQDVVTALVGVGPQNSETGEFLTFEEINDGKLYVGNNDALQRWSKDGKHLFDMYSPQTEDQDMTKQRLKQLTEAELKKRIDSSTSYEVNAVALEKVFGLSHESVRKGDTVRIKDTGFSPPLFLEARLIAADECDTDPSKDKYIFGNYREIKDTRSLIDRLYAQIMGSLSNKASKELLDMLDKKLQENITETEAIRKESEAAKKIAEQVAENLKNNTVDIIEGVNPPTENLKDRKTLWQDISKGKPGILKLWKDGKWDPVVPDVESVKKETLEQVSKDIETTKNELNEKVQSVEGKAQEIVKQISDVQKQVNDKVDQTWINTQLKDKADKAGVYTKDEIKDGFIGKQIYETDKQGNIKNFKDVNTSIVQTNEALKQKAEKSELKNTSDGLSQLEQKTNDIETTAEGTKQILTELQTKVENTKYGIRNFAIDGSFENDIASVGITNGSKNTIITSPVFNGKRALKVDTTASTVVDTGFSMDIRNLESGMEYIACIVIAGENDYTDVLYRIAKTDWGEVVSKKINVTKTWKKEYVTFKATAPTMKIVVLKKGVVMFLDAISVYKGNAELDWSPSPEEMVNSTDFNKKTVEIEKNINGIKESVSAVQNEQGKLTERITKSEQTADGFKTSIESLTKKDTDISYKLNTVEQTVEGTKKTISDVQQTTNGLSKTTTEIKELAGKTSEKLESVEKKFDDIKIGGQNFYKQKSFGVSGGTSITYDDSNKWWNITIPAGASGSWKGILYNSKNATLLVGRTYTISYEIYADEVIPTAIDINNFGVTTATGTNDNDVVAKRIMRVPKTISGQWVKVSATFIMPDNITQDFYDNSALGVGGGWTPTKITNIKIRNMQLEEGNIPTSYRTPSEDQVTTDEFTKKTTEIEKSVTGIKETVTKFENNQSGFDKRVTAVEKTAEGISQNVTKIQETQTVQGKQITEAQSTIKQHSDALDLTVKMKDVENYVGGIGSINEIRNAGLELGNKYWSINQGTAVQPSSKYKGYATFWSDYSGKTSDHWSGTASEFIPVTAGEDLISTGWFATDNIASLDQKAWMEIEFWNATKGTRMRTQRVEIQWAKQGDWARMMMVSKVAANEEWVRWRYYVQRNGRIRAALPMLQRGKVATEFWLHPKDQTNVDKMIEDISNKVATLDYNQKTTELERLISANAEGIKLAAVKTEVYTKQQADERYADKAYVEKQEGRIEVTEKAITSTVQKGDIISAINQTAEKISISVSKLDINADTVVKWLTAKGIDADVIKISGDKVTID
ncbi:phage tail spike protein, partial [Bacillus toyonensis]